MKADQLLAARLCVLAYAAASTQLDRFARQMGFAHWTAFTRNTQFHREEINDECGMLVAPLGEEMYLVLVTPEGGLPADEARFQLSVCEQAPEFELIAVEVCDGALVKISGSLA